MHPIVKEFTETDKKISTILNELSNKEQPVEVVFQILLNKLAKNEDLSFEENKQIDDALETGHRDKNLFLLFVSFLILFYSNKRMYAKSESVYRISSSFSLAEYEPIIQVNYYYTCAYYFFMNSEYTKNDEMRLAAFLVMPKNVPRYQIFLSNFGQLMGILGRIKDLPQEDLERLEKLAETNYAPLGALTDNALFIGDITLIKKYETEMENRYRDHQSSNKNIGKCILEVFQGNLNDKLNIRGDFNVCLAYYRCLKNRDFEKAKLIFGKINVSELCSVFVFVAYHHCFVTGRFEVIEKIIKDHANQSNHYMLDFFLVRYFLVKGKQDLARFYYAKLLQNCEKHNAKFRLKFEMQFAFEMSPDSFFELTLPIQNSISEEKSKVLAAEVISPELDLVGMNRIVGKSKKIIKIKNQVIQFANIQRPILVIGETGVGKEVIARAIHEESSQKAEPFLTINCGALTDTLLQSELFGYEAGSFTGAVHAHKGIFEAAENGVVFLDEFGEMSPKLQVSLLRILENNEVRRIGSTKVRAIKCRIMAATNANIEDLISKKLFREDLYHRLKQFIIVIPALRDRKEDIPELVNYFLSLQNKSHQQSLSKELLQKFQDYQWPGNVRELKNEIDRIKILCGYKPIIEENDIEIEWLKAENNSNKKINQLSEPVDNQLADTDDEEMHQRIINKQLTLADKRNQQILRLFQKYKKLTRGQIAEALQVSALTATKDLQRLCTEGVVVKKTPTLSPRSHYFEIN